MSIANEIQRLQASKADIKAAIEAKGVTVGDGTIDTYADKISEISGGESGGGFQTGVDAIATKAKAITFTDMNFGVQSITLNLNNITTMSNLFYKALGDTSEITINCPNLVTSMNAVFDGDTPDQKLKKITLNVNTEKATTFNAFVWGRKGLEIIDGTPLNFSSATAIGSAFNSCISLREMRIAPNTIKVICNLSACSSFSDETIQSVIDGLATVETTQLLQLHSTVGNKLTDTQKATITAKNWTLVYQG